jgi:guanosine-3',5'-bis(diphosphate) 3'-pyrophosphohydrolase
MNFLLKAVKYAADCHTGQFRKGEQGAPYVNHVLEVASLLAEVGGVTDDEVLAAALLHDTVEDTGATFDEVESLFGERVTSIVREVTDDKTLPKRRRRQLQIDHAPHLSEGATLIKIADKTSNLADITRNPPRNWGHQRRREYIEWGEKVVNNCKKVNEPLLVNFFRVLAEAKGSLKRKGRR